MKHYIQFKTLSTGYVEGFIPPIFDLGNRLSRSSMIEIGLSLCSYTNSLSNSRELIVHLF